MITTIIPTYRRPRYLARAIRSVLDQTWQHVRVEVYDDASNDETEQVVAALAAHDSRVIYHRNQRNLGATMTFRKGLEEVSTEFFSFLSDDDVLLPTFYEHALSEFGRWPQAHATWGITWVVNQEGIVLSDPREWIPAGNYAAPTALAAMLKTKHREWTGLLFRREVRDAIDLIDPGTTVPDFDYMLRCAAVCDIAVYDEPVALFAVHPGSSTYSFGRQFVYPSYALVAEHLRNDPRIPGRVRVWSSRVLERRVNSFLFKSAIKALASGNTAESEAISTLLRDARGNMARAGTLQVLSRACSLFDLRRVLKSLLRANTYLRPARPRTSHLSPIVYAQQMVVPRVPVPDTSQLRTAANPDPLNMKERDPSALYPAVL